MPMSSVKPMPMKSIPMRELAKQYAERINSSRDQYATANEVAREIVYLVDKGKQKFLPLSRGEKEIIVQFGHELGGRVFELGEKEIIVQLIGHELKGRDNAEYLQLVHYILDLIKKLTK